MSLVSITLRLYIGLTRESLLYRAYIRRAGRQCIALTKRKACRASLLWAKRRRGGAVWSSLTSTKAGEFKTKLKINHLRSSPGPPELAGFYVDSHYGAHCLKIRPFKELRLSLIHI